MIIRSSKMSAENHNPERVRAEAYLEVLRQIAEEKGFYLNKWSIIKFPEHSIEVKFVVRKEKQDGEILICSIPENFQAPINETSDL